MAGDAKDRRFPTAPVALAALIPSLTRVAFRKRSPAGAQLMADWGSIIGPAVERLKFVQQAPMRTAPPPPPPRPAPLPASLQARIDSLPPGELRDALAKLAGGVYRKP